MNEEMKTILDNLQSDMDGLYEIWLRGETGQANEVEIIQMLCEHRRKMMGREEVDRMKALNNAT